MTSYYLTLPATIVAREDGRNPEHTTIVLSVTAQSIRDLVAKMMTMGALCSDWKAEQVLTRDLCEMQPRLLPCPRWALDEGEHLLYYSKYTAKHLQDAYGDRYDETSFQQHGLSYLRDPRIEVSELTANLWDMEALKLFDKYRMAYAEVYGTEFLFHPTHNASTRTSMKWKTKHYGRLADYGSSHPMWMGDLLALSEYITSLDERGM